MRTATRVTSLQLSEFQVAEATHTALPARVREVLIIVVGAVWRADYELYAQGPVGRKAGLSDEAITTLIKGGIPQDPYRSREDRSTPRAPTVNSSPHRRRAVP